MKKIISGIILGIAAGVVGTFLLLRASMPAATKSAPPEKESEKSATGLHMTREQQVAAGILTTNPIPTELKPEIKAYGRVLDAAPLASLLAEIESARAAAAAS